MNNYDQLTAWLTDEEFLVLAVRWIWRQELDFDIGEPLPFFLERQAM